MNHARRIYRSLAVFLLLALEAFSETILSATYRFDAPEVLETGPYAQIKLAEATPLLRTGAPLLPVVLVSIPLPYGADDLVLESHADETREITLPLPPDFARCPRIPGMAQPEGTAEFPDEAIYGRDAFYPGADAKLLSVQKAGDRWLAIVRLQPIQVNPVTRELRSASSISIRLSSKGPRKRLARLAPPSTDTSWEYLLVTTNTLVEAFTRLADFKRENGTKVQVKAVSEIYRDYPGEDAPAKIRACIRDGYRNHGTRYVLLGGDIDSVPIRRAFGRVGATVDEGIPTDVYYACLDGSWNGNGNDRYGEPDDGVDGQPLDLMAEVYVGRAPVDTEAEATAFVEKTIRYSSRPHPNPLSVLLAGEYLNSFTVDGSTVYPQGGEQLDTLLEYFHGHEVSWLDDRPAHGEQWDAADISGALAAPPNIVAHDGHGTPGHAMRLSSAQAAALTNPFPFLLHSIACNAARLDFEGECFGEAMMNHQGGAASAVLNTREGWFDVINPHLYSGEFQEAYVREVVQSRLPLGEAMARARESMVGKVEGSDVRDRPYRWIYYSSTLFGDPQLPLQAPYAWKVVAPEGTSRKVIAGEGSAPRPLRFEIFNTAPRPRDWTATVSAPFLALSASSGTTPSNNSTTIELSLDGAKCLKPGRHGGEIVFRSPGMTNEVFSIKVDVLARPDVTDSLGASDDAALPFPETPAGLTAPGTIRIENRDASQPLAIDRIELDGRDISLTGRPIDLLCFDATRGWLCSLQAEKADSPVWLGTNGFAKIGALETVPSEPGILYALVYGTNRILRIDAATGAILEEKTAWPEISGDIWSGLAYNIDDGGLYAASTDGVDTSFYRIDRKTLTPVPLARTKENTPFIAIAFDGRGTLFGIETESNSLRAVDPFTGVTRRIGPLDVDARYSQGLDTDSRGERLLWASFSADLISEIKLLDPKTAKATVLAALPRQKGAWNNPELEIAVQPYATPFGVNDALPVAIPPGAAATFRVFFAPDRAGDFSGSLSFYAKDDDAPFATLACSGRSERTSAIPEAWLVAHGLPVDGSAEGRDPDGDGFTNLEEWRCGTDPKDALSCLRFTGSEWRQGRLVFTWPATPGRIYTLLQSDSLAPPAFAPVKSVLAKGPRVTATVPINRTNRFYRIQLDTGE